MAVFEESEFNRPCRDETLRRFLEKAGHCVAEALSIVQNHEDPLVARSDVENAISLLGSAGSELEYLINYPKITSPFGKEHGELSRLAEQGLLAVLNTSIHDLEFTVRVWNCLDTLHLLYVGSLVQLRESDYLKLHNFGRKSLKEVKETLTKMGLSLNMSTVGWLPPLTSVSINGKWVKVAGAALGWEQVLRLHDPLIRTAQWKVGFQISTLGVLGNIQLLSPNSSVKLSPGMVFSIDPLANPRRTSMDVVLSQQPSDRKEEP